MTLVTTRNLDDPDAIYEMLVAAHEGLDEAASAALNARLVLVLANHIGEAGVLREALAAARAATRTPSPLDAASPG